MAGNAYVENAERGREVHDRQQTALDAAVADMPPFDPEAFVEDFVKLAEWRRDREASAWTTR
ncbi:MAG: hypothetical protein EA355_13955 [Rhodobacteraceae bacterium]|nr:MAG: hypothetical protein EA355_13955 [Paracoccaceae bacterium]